MQLMHRWPLEHRLALFMGLFGAVFLVASLEHPTLSFQELPPSFPASFKDRRGFFSVHRWLESLHSAPELEKMLDGVRRMHTTSPKLMPRAHSLETADALIDRLGAVSRWETAQQVAKMGVQWGLLLFLFRVRALSKRAAVPSVGLCVVVMTCSRIVQSSLVELVSRARERGTSPIESRRLAFVAALMWLLFLFRYLGMCVLNAVMGRAYQRHFGGWPGNWKEVPKYIGSKDFALSTLFYSASAVACMTATATGLSSLSEAALNIENFALGGALSHFVYHQFNRHAKVA
ncbi:hypothetical protein ATCC90586_001732 [Pythium insidiosum]|nr:hypothetical protein ATCC90586_001732 [Pythium insidiosum]